MPAGTIHTSTGRADSLLLDDLLVNSERGVFVWRRTWRQSNQRSSRGIMKLDELSQSLRSRGGANGLLTTVASLRLNRNFMCSTRCFLHTRSRSVVDFRGHTPREGAPWSKLRSRRQRKCNYAICLECVRSPRSLWHPM